MSDNPCAVVERQAFRHFHLCGDPPPIVALILRSSSVLPFRVGPRLVPGSRHRLRDAARSPVMPDAFWGHGTGPKPPINSAEGRCPSRSKGSSWL